MSGLLTVGAALAALAASPDTTAETAAASQSVAGSIHQPAPALVSSRCNSDAPSGSGGSPVPAPSGRFSDMLNGLGVELEINNDKPKTTFSLGRKLRPCTESDGLPGSPSMFSQVSLTGALSLPIGGEDDLTDPQTLDKLSNGPSLTFGVSRYSYTSRVEGATVHSSAGLQFGGEVTLGFNRFHHREPVSLEKRTDDKAQYGVSAFVAVYPTDFRSVVSFSVKYQSAWEAQDETIVCKPVVIVPADDCASAAPGGPERSDGLLLGAEYRRTFDIGGNFADLAISPLVTYDALDDEFGVEFPIYLLPIDAAPVLPGVKVGYSTKDEEVTFGVFLKSSFSLGY